MKSFAKTAVHAFAAFGLASAAVSPALAQEFDHRTASVSYADVDLGTAKGQKILERRIEKALRHVCGMTNLDTGTRIMNSDALNCLAKARADAKRQVAALMTIERRGG